MIRGRLVGLNDKPVTPADFTEERAQRLVDREFNLSWGSELPSGNTVTAGAWHGDAGKAEFSVEQGLAETLGLQIGDRLDYQIAGRRLVGEVTSLRKLEWDSMRVNFFVIAAPGMLEDYPASYITSFHLPSGRESVIGEVLKRAPNLTVIDMGALLRQIQETLNQVIGAVQLIFGFALAVGVVVLFAALQASGDERRRELSILRALGARERQLTRAMLAEYVVLGGLTGFLGGVGASLIGWALARFAFHLDYLPDPLIWGGGMLIGTVLVSTAGLLGMRSILRQPAVEGLRAG
jgi:putative ABC transport system permease protein